jgi:ankyrin repeat protein
MTDQRALKDGQGMLSNRTSFRFYWNAIWTYGILVQGLLAYSTFTRAQVRAHCILKAVQSSDIRSLEDLLKYHDQKFPDTTDREQQRTALHYAVIQRDIAIVQVLVKYGMKLDVLDKEGRSPLALAVLGSDADIARLILEHGDSKCCQKCASNESPLHGSLVADCMLERAYSPSESPKPFGLFRSKGGSFRKLLKHPKENHTLLHIAVSQTRERRYEITKLLVDHGAALWRRNCHEK